MTLAKLNPRTNDSEPNFLGYRKVLTLESKYFPIVDFGGTEVLCLSDIFCPRPSLCFLFLSDSLIPWVLEIAICWYSDLDTRFCLD